MKENQELFPGLVLLRYKLSMPLYIFKGLPPPELLTTSTSKRILARTPRGDLQPLSGVMYFDSMHNWNQQSFDIFLRFTTLRLSLACALLAWLWCLDAL
jgi:hypothetical protein